MILKLTQNGFFVLAIFTFIFVSFVLYLLVDQEFAPKITILLETEKQKLKENVETLKSQLRANQIIHDHLDQKLEELIQKGIFKFNKNRETLKQKIYCF